MKKTLLYILLMVLMLVGSPSFAANVQMDALTDASSTATSSHYLIGYSGSTSVRMTIGSILGLYFTFGTPTDLQSLQYNASTGKWVPVSSFNIVDLDMTATTGYSAPFKAGLAASLPATCVAGSTYWATNTKALYLCTATNTWTSNTMWSGSIQLLTDDSAAQFKNSSDASKRAKIDVSGMSTTKTGTIKPVCTQDCVLTTPSLAGNGELVEKDATQTLTGKTHTAPKETVVAGGTCSTSYAIDSSAGSLFTLTLNGACALSITNAAAGRSFAIKMTQSSTTAPTFTGFTWPAGTAPTWSTSATKYDVISCICFDGSTWQCNGIVDVR